MRKLVLAFVLLMQSGAVFAQGCGVQPLPPYQTCGGKMQAVCVCSADGRCFWQFICTP